MLKRSIQVWLQKRHCVLHLLLEKVLFRQLTFLIVPSDSCWGVCHRQTHLYYTGHSISPPTTRSYLCWLVVLVRLLQKWLTSPLKKETFEWPGFRECLHLFPISSDKTCRPHYLKPVQINILPWCVSETAGAGWCGPAAQGQGPDCHPDSGCFGARLGP